jgi:integrase
LLAGLNHNHLQSHIDRRRKKVAGVTIRKEITTFGAAWAWALRGKLVEGEYPAAGLRYPIDKEPLPYMTLAEVERRIKAGGDPTELYEAVYLDAKQIAQVLTHVKKRPMPNWVYPMFVMVAHTGARRAELLRAEVGDIDLSNRVVTLREKKRKRGIHTTRRVPISDLLAKALKPILAERDRIYLFGDGQRPLTVDEAKQVFWKTFEGSKWYKPLSGFHNFRHSFVSALAAMAVDQRLIDEFTGHRTEMQRRRYRHLLPTVTREAIKLVFG